MNVSRVLGRNASRLRRLTVSGGTQSSSVFSTHEDLQLRAHQQDNQIHQLLAQFDNLKANNRIRDRMTRTEHNGITGVRFSSTYSCARTGSKRTNYPDRFEILARGDSPTEMQVIAAFAPSRRNFYILPDMLILMRSTST